MSIQHMSDEERTKSLQDDEIRIKKVTYNIPLFEGVREEVYSEWIDWWQLRKKENIKEPIKKEEGEGE